MNVTTTQVKTENIASCIEDEWCITTTLLPDGMWETCVFMYAEPDGNVTGRTNTFKQAIEDHERAVATVTRDPEWSVS